MLTSLFVLILMTADTEKLSILSFSSDPAQSFPADSSGDPDCDPIRNSGSRISVQFSHICFQSIFIELELFQLSAVGQRSFSPHFPWNWVVMNIPAGAVLGPPGRGFPQSHINFTSPADTRGNHGPRPARTAAAATADSRPIGSRGGRQPISGRIQHVDWIVRILDRSAGIFDISIMLLMIHQ